MTHPFGLLRQSIEAGLTSVKKLSKKNFHFPCFQDMLPRLRGLIGLQYRRLVNKLSIFKIVMLWKCSWLLPHEQVICICSLIWLSLNKSVKKSRFSRIVKNSREFSLLDLDLEAFWFHFSLLEKEWKHFDFTLHFSKKSESIFFSLCTSRKRVKAFYFHFSLLELQKPTLAGPWNINAALCNREAFVWVGNWCKTHTRVYNKIFM